MPKSIFAAKLNQKNVFLVDGVGAVFSAVFTGLLLPLLSDWHGLSDRTLYVLVLFPIVFAVYSLCRYALTKKPRPWMLLVIVTGNLVYCLISAGLIFTHDAVTGTGQALLALEVLVVLAVVAVELTVYRKSTTVPSPQ